MVEMQAGPGSDSPRSLASSARRLNLLPPRLAAFLMPQVTESWRVVAILVQAYARSYRTDQESARYPDAQHAWATGVVVFWFAFVTVRK